MAIKSAMAMVSMKEKGHFEHEDAKIDKYTVS